MTAWRAYRGDALAPWRFVDEDDWVSKLCQQWCVDLPWVPQH
jgi:hypothetical protein